MEERGGRGRLRWIATVSLAAALLTSCGGSDAGTEDMALPPTGTAEVTATVAPLASPPEPATASPVAVLAVPVATPPLGQAFTSEQADLGPLQWAAMVDPTTLAPVQLVETFATTASTIYAVLPVRRVEAGSVISAVWTYNDTPINGVGSSVTISETTADVWLEFHLARTTVPEWPDGTYAIVVLVDGEPALASTIMISPG